MSTSIIPSKKSKLTASGSSTSSSSSSRSVTSNSADAWETLALEVDPPDLVPLVLDASDLDEGDKVVSLI